MILLSKIFSGFHFTVCFMSNGENIEIYTFKRRNGTVNKVERTGIHTNFFYEGIV